MKKVLFLVLAVVLLMALTVTSLGAPRKVTLRLAWWGNPTRDERTLKAVEIYTKLNPHIVIETETTGWAGYWDKLASQAAANNLPDIIQHDYAYITQYAERNLLLDLTPYVKAKTLDLTGVAETFTSGGMVKNKLVGVSLGTNAFCLAYDPAVLKKAGLNPPAPDWTWADFEKMATTIYNKTGVLTPVFCSTDPKVAFDNMIRQTGASFFDPSGTKLGFTDTALLKEFYQIQLRLLKAGMMTKPEVGFLTVTPQESEFTKGNEWITFVWSNQFVMTQEAANRPLEMALMPTIEGAKQPGTFLKPSMFFSVARSSKQAKEAVKFINFFINDVETNKVLLAERGIPIVPQVRNALKEMVTPVNRQIFEFIDLAGEHSSPIDPADPPGAGEVLNLFRTIDQEVLYGAVSPENAATRFMKEANTVLGRNR